MERAKEQNQPFVFPGCCLLLGMAFCPKFKTRRAGVWGREPKKAGAGPGGSGLPRDVTSYTCSQPIAKLCKLFRKRKMYARADKNLYEGVCSRTGGGREDLDGRPVCQRVAARG